MDDILMPDVDAAKQFLTVLDPSDIFSFRTFDDRDKDRALAKCNHGHFDDFAADLGALNQFGAGVFVTVNESDGAGHGDKNVTAIRALFVDLDGAPLDPVKKWSLKPHIIVESSPERWHAYWLVDGFPLDRFRDAQQAIADRFGGDRSICNLSRVMRLPGFYHQKGEPVMVTVKSIDADHPPYAADEMMAALEVGTAPVPAKAGRRDPITEGKRNLTLTEIGGRMRRVGKSSAEIEDVLTRINSEECDPPLDEAEVRKIAGSIASYRRESSMPTGIATSDTGNAQRFVEQHGDDVRFVPEQGKWLVWKGGHWGADAANLVIQHAKQTAKSLFENAAETTSDTSRMALAKHAVQSLNRSRLAAMIALASSEPEVVTRMRDLDRNDFMLGVENGIVDLRSGEFRPARREDLLTQRCGTQFNASATCPTFERFLSRVTGGNIELQAYLQRLVGYALTGDTREHCFAFLYGHGANGKSTFLDTLTRLIGNYACQTQPETLMARRGGGASSDLARLVGKRLVVSNEIREGAHLEENLVKQLVGGDMVTARFLYQEHFEFRPKFKLLIAGNHQPVIKGDDDGIWRRVHLVPFVHTIPEKERDKGLGEKLAKELSGILNWAIAGCLEWQKRGLDAPKIITEATARYREEMDLLGAWIEQECEKGAGFRYSSRQLYENYRRWCEMGGIKPMSAMVFVRKLETRKFLREHTRLGNILLGIRLKDGIRSVLAIAA